MKKILLSLLFLTFSVQARDIAILAAPGSNKDSLEILDLLKENQKISLGLNEDASAAVILKAKEKQAETVCSLSENPFSSLLYFPSQLEISYINQLQDNPYFFALRMGTSQKYLEKSSAPCEGALLLYGDLKKSQLTLLKSMNYSWAAISSKTASSTSAINDFQGIKTVSFEHITSSISVILSSASFFFFEKNDYSDSLTSEAVKDLLNTENLNFLTVKDLLKISTAAFQSEPPSSQPWLDYTAFLKKQEQYSYLSALSKVRYDLVIYLNSKPEKEKAALDLYIQAEKILNKLYREEDNEAMEEEAVNSLSDIYRFMGTMPPDFVYKPFSGKKTQADYEITRNPEEVYFFSKNPDSSITSFSVKKSDGKLFFMIKTSTSAAFEKITAYMDINSSIGVGAMKLLEKNLSEKIEPKSAWDYALEINKTQAKLSRYSPYNILPVSVNLVSSKNEILTFSIDSSKLPQNFEKWKYIVLVFENEKIKDGIYKEIAESGLIYPI